MDLSGLILTLFIGVAADAPSPSPSTSPSISPSSQLARERAALAVPDLSTPQSAWLESKVCLDTGNYRRFAQVTHLSDDGQAWANSLAEMYDAGRALRAVMLGKFGTDALRVMGGIPGAGGGLALRGLAEKDARELMSRMEFKIDDQRATVRTPGASQLTHIRHDASGWHVEYAIPRERLSQLQSETALNNELGSALRSLAYSVFSGEICTLQAFQVERARLWRQAFNVTGGLRQISDYPATQPSTQPSSK